MNTTVKRHAAAFADDLIPENVWFLHSDAGAKMFECQDAMLQWIEKALTEDEIHFAVSSCRERGTGTRVMVTHNALTILDWLEGLRGDIERERQFMQRDRNGTPA